jgi:hypothetical protein
VPVTGYGDLLALSARLRQMGEQGQGLRRELLKSLQDGAEPVAKVVSSLGYLKAYMPDRYAAVLAPEIAVTIRGRLSAEPSVRLLAQSHRPRRRKLKRLNEGFLTHPLYGNREHWYTQTGGMRPGFFTEPAQKSAPEIRDHVLAAMAETARKITG